MANGRNKGFIQENLCVVQGRIARERFEKAVPFRALVSQHLEADDLGKLEVALTRGLAKRRRRAVALQFGARV